MKARSNWRILNVALLCGALVVGGVDRAYAQSFPYVLRPSQDYSESLEIQTRDIAALIQQLKSNYLSDRLAATQEIGRRAKVAQKSIPTVASWVSHEVDPWRSWRGVDSLIEMGALAKITILPLTLLLHDPDPLVRSNAIDALEHVEASAKVLDANMPEIFSGLSPENVDPTVRLSAVRMSARLGTPKLVIPKLHVLLGQKDYLYPWTRPAIIGALVEMGETELVTPMIALLQDPNPEVRGKAARELGEIGKPAKMLAKPNLMLLLEDPVPYVRISAARVMCGMGESEVAIPYLIPLLKHPLRSVRHNAIEAFGSQECLQSEKLNQPGICLECSFPTYWEKLDSQVILDFLQTPAGKVMNEPIDSPSTKPPDRPPQ
jgi:HEAT repeat protein